MSIGDEVYRLFAEKLGKSVKDLTTSERKAAEAAFSSGKNSVKSDSTSSENTTTPSSLTTALSSSANVGGGLSPTGALEDAKASALGLSTTLSSIPDVLDGLIKDAQGLANSMGIGRARAGELRTTIADTLPEMVKLGIETGTGLEYIKKIPETLKTNTTLANETIVELAATAKFTGQDIGVLVDGFRNVGTQMSSVGDEMTKVANYAKSIGVNVNAVTSGVVTNLKQLNLFNFDGGVQGLAKMTAQSATLGVNMSQVFAKAEKLLNPEAAIEFSSALQRLGVTSTELLDPLSAMDMALNDPAKLQDEMTKVAKQFTKLKADGTGFEILPGAKLQLREVAETLGMGADELASMAIKGADLDMKLKQIRFPSFAASEEDRMLIANMSEMKDGKAFVKIEGEDEPVAVEDLTDKQFDKLREQQSKQAMSADEIARSQLDVQTEIKNAIIGGTMGVKLGVASQEPLQRLADTNLEIRGNIARNLYGAPKAKGVREMTEGVSEPVEGAITQLVSGGLGIENLFKVGDKIIDALNGFENIIKETSSGFLTGAKEAYQSSVVGLSKRYEGMGEIQKIEKSEVNTEIFDKIIEINNNVQQGIENYTKEIFVKQTVDFTNSDGSLKAIDSDVLNKAYNHMMFKLPNTPEDLRKLDEGFKSVTSGL